MYNLFSQLKQSIFPPFCAYCKDFLREDMVLCATCKISIRPVVSYALEVTATKLVEVIAVGAYDQPLSSLILAKSRGNRTVAHQLGILAWQESVIRHIHFDYIIPIPLHWTRYAWRGYNQADEIARVIGIESKRPLVHVVKRVRRTPFQSSFKGEDRKKNMSNAFQLTLREGSEYGGKHLLLVDDVMTSGATLIQAAKELYRLKPASVSALVIARVA